MSEFSELLFPGVVGLATIFAVFLLLVIVIVSIEMMTGTILGQWPEKIHAFFKRRGWVVDRNHQT